MIRKLKQYLTTKRGIAAARKCCRDNMQAALNGEFHSWHAVAEASHYLNQHNQ